MKKPKGKAVKEVPTKFVTEVARLRELQTEIGYSESKMIYWTSEVAVQLARLVAQMRYNDSMDEGIDFYA